VPVFLVALALSSPPPGETTTTAFIPPAQTIPYGVAGAAAVQRRFVRAHGRAGGETFAVDLRRGPVGKVAFAGLRSVRLTSIRFAAHRVTLRGVGVLDGRRVRFAAVAADNGRRGDRFRIAWGGGPSRGGAVTRGGVTIR
jgi:hypothetical protein